MKKSNQHQNQSEEKKKVERSEETTTSSGLISIEKNVKPQFVHILVFVVLHFLFFRKEEF